MNINILIAFPSPPFPHMEEGHSGIEAGKVGEGPCILALAVSAGGGDFVA